MSAMCCMTRFSSRMPLPPSRSRATAAIRRAARVLWYFASDAWVGRRPPAGLEVGQVTAVQLHRGQLVEHLRQALLHHLELRERLAELHALLRVRQGRLVAGRRVPERRPGDAGAGRVQHGGGVLERLRSREDGIERHPHVGQPDVRLVDRAQRRLAEDRPAVVARRSPAGRGSRAPCRRDRGLRVVDPRPHERDAAGRAVADPLLRAVEHPRVAIASRPRSRARPSPSRGRAR